MRSHLSRIQQIAKSINRSSRSYASSTNAPSPTLGVGGGVASFQVFDRNLKHLHRDNAASNVLESRKVDYLRDEVANRLADRLLFINRTFHEVLDLGAGACHILKAITRPLPADHEYAAPAAGESNSTSPELGTTSASNKSSGVNQLPLSARIHHLTCAEMSAKMLNRDADEISTVDHPNLSITRLDVDEESVLNNPPSQGGLFEDNTFDAVLSSGSLHWINDLPTVLHNINRVLKPDGLFLAAMFGGDCLYELRTSLQLADMERLGGVSPHVSPLADVRDMGGLMQRAGFKLLTVDVDDIVVEYPSVFDLMKDLGKMGESNAVLGRQKSAGGLKKEVLMGLEGVYRELHGDEGGQGGIPATFRIIYMIGWKEGPNQQKPLPRGSADTSLKDVL